MIVYGDATRVANPVVVLDGVAEVLRNAAAMGPGIERHAALVTAFIAAGELVQAVADVAFDARGGEEACSPSLDAAMAGLTSLAQAVWRSWTRGFAAEPPPSPAVLAPVLAPGTPDTVTLRTPEGFAFYALYPEAYAAAARASGLSSLTRVIGLRSIGVSLGAMVAAALGAEPPITLRPTGHPFRRALRLAGTTRHRLLAPAPGGYAVVDEGPGLSGSSFGAVADLLEDAGIPPAAITFFPGHGGDPGPEASARHRARWAAIARPVVDFGALVLDAANPRHRLAQWLIDLLGPLDGPLVDVAGGRWRNHRGTGASLPPVHAQQERRKYLFRAAGATWVAKFAGLGAEGSRKLDRARRLQAAGFTPPVAGLRHGFLVERWIADATPLDIRRPDEAQLVRQVGRYLAFLARTFPADTARGASLDALWAMARHNTAKALGEPLARRFDSWTPALRTDLGRRVRRVETDNRMHAWEWLTRPDGTAIKCDALDHHAAHDLVGCQDIAWDVVGAGVELSLGKTGEGELCRIIAAETGRSVDPLLLDFLEPCYLAFHLGATAMATDVTGDAAEVRRLRRRTAFYADRLQAALADRRHDGPSGERG